MICGCCHRTPEPVEDKSDNPVKPPRRRKKTLFQESKFQKVDQHSSQVDSKYLQKDIEKLVNHLTKYVDPSDDLAKLRSLFVWITRLNLDEILQREILEDVKPKQDLLIDLLSKLKANLINHACLFQILCSHANIKCEVITGINKNSYYKIGYHLNLEKLKAQWNAVYVCSEWRLIDTYWASCGILGSRSADWVIVNLQESTDTTKIHVGEEASYLESRIVNDFYFLTDPDMFICTHLPDDPQWQLLPHPISQSRFGNTVYTREKFFLLGLYPSILTKSHCVLVAADGLIEVGFGISEAKSSSAEFRFLFFNLKDHFNFDPALTLEHYVLSQLSKDTVSFTLRFPQKGTFRFDIFGRENPDDMFDMVCSYVIQCKAPKEKFLPLPFIPEAGWGPTIACHKMGIIPKSHQSALIISDDGSCDIMFAIDKQTWMKYKVLTSSKENYFYKKNVIAWREQEHVHLQTRFKDEAEYALKIMASNLTSLSKVENVCNYLVDVKSSSVASTFPLLRGSFLGPTDLADHFQVQPDSYKSAIIRTADREVSIAMTMAEDVEMMAEITNNLIDNKVIYTHVTREQTTGKVVFNINLTHEHEFGINLYVSRNSRAQAIYHVFTYYVIIEVPSPTSHKNQVDVTPSNLNILTTPESEQFSRPSIEEQTQPDVVVPILVTTAKNSIKARAVTRLNPMFCELKPEETWPFVIKKLGLTSTSEDSDTLFTVGLPEFGKYDLNLFEEITPGFISVFTEYHICRKENVVKDVDEVRHEMSEEEKEEILQKKRNGRIFALRKAVKVGLSTKNTRLLQQSLRQLEELNAPDDDELISEAKVLVLSLSIRDAITKAISDRDQKHLEYLLDSISDNGLINNFSVEVMAAKRLLEYLKQHESLQRLHQQCLDVLNLDSRMVSEIRSYLNPPTSVQLVMTATCILLGEDREQLQEWSSIRKIISQSNKMSLQNRVYQSDMKNVTIDMIRNAKEILQQLAEDDFGLSPAAEKFYAWVKGTVEVTELHHQHEEIWGKKCATKKRSKILSAVQDIFLTKNKSIDPTEASDNAENIGDLPKSTEDADSLPPARTVYELNKRRPSKFSLVSNKRRQSIFSNTSITSSKTSEVDRYDNVKTVWKSLEK